MIDRTKFKPARERAPKIAALASQGMTSREISAALGDISEQRVRAIAKRFCIVLARAGTRRFGFYAAERRAKVIITLAAEAGCSPATMIDRITRVVLDDGIDQARKRLGKFAIAATTYNKQANP